MNLNTLQNLRMEQKLRLAPRMIQSMEILQLPLIALEERLEQELEKNPTLEIRDIEPESSNQSELGSESSTDSGERDLVITETNDKKDDFNRLDEMEQSYPTSDNWDAPRSHSARMDDEDPKMQALSNTAAREISLQEYLAWQWDLIDVEVPIRQAGDIIINNIEPDGYLRTGFDKLAEDSGLPNDQSLWEKALREVQNLEPPGIGARTAQECLLLQLDALEEDRPIERELVANYFFELQNQHYQKICKNTAFTLEQIKASVEFIKSRLMLHPGSAIGSKQTVFVVPDVILEYEEDGSYKVNVPEGNIPQLYISGHYRRMLNDPNLDPNTRKYIRNNIQSAQWIIDAILQRKETLRKVAEVVVCAQREFLESGPKYMRPLPMAQVADKVGIHVATVSRAVAEKYILTPKGMYPLRSFFTGGTETESGESVSWDSIRTKIQELIDAEDKTNPYGDEEIIKLLKKDGINVARRTVTKYRKMMGIPSSHKRREK